MAAARHDPSTSPVRRDPDSTPRIRRARAYPAPGIFPEDRTTTKASPGNTPVRPSGNAITQMPVGMPQSGRAVQSTPFARQFRHSVRHQAAPIPELRAHPPHGLPKGCQTGLARGSVREGDRHAFRKHPMNPHGHRKLPVRQAKTPMRASRATHSGTNRLFTSWRDASPTKSAPCPWRVARTGAHTESLPGSTATPVPTALWPSAGT